jgi:hypothetical protein
VFLIIAFGGSLVDAAFLTPPQKPSSQMLASLTGSADDDSHSESSNRRSWTGGHPTRTRRMGIAGVEGGKRQRMHSDRSSGATLERLHPGIVIETIRETHRGPFSGQHARYVLRSLITILEKEGGKS